MTVPIAVAVTQMTAAERGLRAIKELIVDPAMIGAIWPAGEILPRAVIAKSWRQLIRRLPIDAGQYAGLGQARYLDGLAH